MQGRHQFNSEAGRRKRYPWKVFFPMKHFHYFPREHQKNVLFEVCDCFRGLFVGFKGLQDDSNNILLLHSLLCLNWQCQISQLVTICYSMLFLPAKLTFQTVLAKRETHFVTASLPCEICVRVKLFTTSESSTLGKCYSKEDTIISGGALGSQQGALHFSNTAERPSPREKPFPAHTRKADRQPFNNSTSNLCAKIFGTAFQSYHNLLWV